VVIYGQVAFMFPWGKTTAQHELPFGG